MTLIMKACVNITREKVLMSNLKVSPYEHDYYLLLTSTDLLSRYSFGEGWAMRIFDILSFTILTQLGVVFARMKARLALAIGYLFAKFIVRFSSRRVHVKYYMRYEYMSPLVYTHQN
jgi:hypothetical protein